MQGSKLSPILFNIFINDLLERLQESGLGFALEHIIVTALGFADDVLLIAEDPSNRLSSTYYVEAKAGKTSCGSI